jgi:hypothetical protein
MNCESFALPQYAYLDVSILRLNMNNLPYFRPQILLSDYV